MARAWRGLPARYPQRPQSVASFLDATFGSTKRRIALAANLCYLDNDPARLWFLFFAMVQANYLAGGGHYLRAARNP